MSPQSLASTLSPAMRRALEVLVDAGGTARYSNLTARGHQTHDGKTHGPTVYHQSADRLVAAGFARVVRSPRGVTTVEISDRGRKAIGGAS